MQKNAADFSRRLGHENARAGEASHSQSQRADVVLMGVRHQDRFDLALADCFEIRRGILPGEFRVHSAIQQKAVSANLEIVRIGPDLDVPREICKFQMYSTDVLRVFLSERLLSEQSLSRWV